MLTDDGDRRRREERLKKLMKQKRMIAKVFERVDELLRDMADLRGRSKVLYEFQEELEVEWEAPRPTPRTIFIF